MNIPSDNKKRAFNIYLIRNVVLSFIFIFVAFALGYYVGNKNFKVSYARGSNVTIDRQLPAGSEDLDFSLFWQVWDTLGEKYYDSTKLNPRNMIYGAIQGMVASVGDPYTAFFTPDQNKVIQEDLSGSFDGIGIQIGFREGRLAVIAPLTGSPAEKAGLKAGDEIIRLKDEAEDIDTDTTGMSLQEAVQIIRGKKGTSILVTIFREGLEEPLEISVVREEIDVPTLTLEIIGENENIANIKLNRFGGETMTEWEQVVRDILKNQKVDKIIIDLRNNPGGYLKGAQDLGSEFLQVGDIVVIEEIGDSIKNEYEVERLGRLTNYDIVVLVNGGSASASEILAGALRDNLKTPIIGETTFGKGTIQEPQMLENGSGFHITIAKWLTPNGTWVNEVGLTPDHEVADDPETQEDEQLQKAIEVLSN